MREAERIADLELALSWALGVLIHFEPGDSRAVSDEFVSAAAIHANLDDLASARRILTEGTDHAR